MNKRLRDSRRMESDRAQIEEGNFSLRPTGGSCYKRREGCQTALWPRNQLRAVITRASARCCGSSAKSRNLHTFSLPQVREHCRNDHIQAVEEEQDRDQREVIMETESLRLSEDHSGYWWRTDCMSCRGKVGRPVGMTAVFQESEIVYSLD